MWRLFIGILILALTGCSSSAPFWARHMSTEDVEQAERLAGAIDQKFCTYAKGSGSAYGIEGYVEMVKAEGQNVSFQDCMSFLNKTSQSVILPASRVPINRPPPPPVVPAAP